MSVTRRRTAIRGAGLAALAGLVGFASTARATPATADAALIQACAEMVELQRKFSDLFDRRNSIEDEERTEPELMVLYDQETQIEDRITALPPPVTMDGAQALARMTLKSWQMDFMGEPIAADFDEWARVSVLEYLAGDAIT